MDFGGSSQRGDAEEEEDFCVVVEVPALFPVLLLFFLLLLLDVEAEALAFAPTTSAAEGFFPNVAEEEEALTVVFVVADVC